jgi:hypothetical protein
VSQSHTGFFQLKLDHRHDLPLVFGCDRRWILIAEVSVGNRLGESVPLHHPILDAPLLPFSQVLGGDPALQLCRECSRVAVDVFEQPRVLDPMKVVGMIVEDHVARVAAAVAIVFIVQRLVKVTHEMNHEFEGLCLRVFVGIRVFQDGEELFRLGDNAMTVSALAGQVDLGIRQGDVDVMPWAGRVVVFAVLVGPACHGVNCATIQQIARFGLCIGRHIFHGSQRYDLMPLIAPRKAERRGEEEGKHEEHRRQKFPHNNLRQPDSEDPKSWGDSITTITGGQDDSAVKEVRLS